MKQLRTLTLVVLCALSMSHSPLLNAVSTPETLVQTQCLANNVYFEARGESFKGKLAVAIVTINRTTDSRFPDSICGVVSQKGQFSWYRKKQPKITDFGKWQESLLAANMAMEDPGVLGKFKALYFHNHKVSPAWGRKSIAKIGNHTFY